MTALPQSKPVWQVRRVVELTADLAETALPWIESSAAIDDSLLFDLWNEGRQLTTDWQRRLDLVSPSARSIALEQDLLLTTLAHEVLAMEIPTRIVVTVAAAIDRRRERPEYRPILEHVLFGFQHVRHQILTRILDSGERYAALDRFRRRCERWTDLLLGPCVVKYGMAAFAHDARRSWEFGEDLLTETAMDVTQQLVRPSLLTSFQGLSGRSPIQSEHAIPFLQSIMSLLPVSLASGRWQRWQSESSTAQRSTDFSHPQLWQESEESPSLSLLDRCLKIAEWRRARDTRG